jgi:hypothetical protein
MKQTIDTFTGETIVYDDTTHTYYDLKGNRLVGASSYAKKFAKPFPKNHIIQSLTKKWDASR